MLRTFSVFFSRIFLLLGLASSLHAVEIVSLPLLLPKTVWAVVDREANIYFDNLTFALFPNQFIDTVVCTQGSQFSERWSYFPKADEKSLVLPWGIEVRDLQGALLGKAETSIHLAKADAGAGKSIRLLCIGDSLTNASGYTGELLQLFSGTNNPTLTLLGTRKISSAVVGNVHEGYGGWTWQRFLTQFNSGAPTEDLVKMSSPFVFQTAGRGPAFDFPQYLKAHCDGKAPDFITILLGVNDVMGLKDDTREEGVATILQMSEKVIAGIREGAPNAKIGILTPPPPASQDAWGVSYGCRSRYVYLKNLQCYVAGLIARYGNREAEGIYLVPTHLNLDAEHAYPAETHPANNRCQAMVLRQTNGVHPSGEGYKQMADTIYAWMKNML